MTFCMRKLSIGYYLIICCFLFSNLIDGQICNLNDKFSGGLIFYKPLGSGGTKPTNKSSGKPWPTDYCDFDEDGLSVAFDKDANGAVICESPESDFQGWFVFYFLFLMWTFMGVGLFADVFMGAIEVITSKKKYIEVPDKDGNSKQVEVYIWNATVANLTLMALGSSAPEILLSVIEIVAGNFFSGDLGPSTIVGSAAFNLYVILAVCVSAIPAKSDDESGFRKIDQMGVFYCTAFASVFAYVWLLIILQGITPDVVDDWEAIMTFLFFPLLVIISWLIDAGKCPCGKKPVDPGNLTGINHPTTGVVRFDDISEVSKILKGHKLKGKNSDYLAQIALAKTYQNTRITRATRRVNAGRMLTGGKAVIPVLPDLSQLKEQEVDIGDSKGAWIRFESIEYSIREGDGNVELTVVCEPVKNGATLSGTFTVDYKTGADGDTATPDQDYESKQGTLTFSAGELKQTIKVTIIEDDEEEDNETFTVLLSNATGDAKILKTMGSAQVTIIDDDSPGVISFREHKDEPTATTDETNAEEKKDTAIELKKVKKKKAKIGSGSVVYRVKESDGHVAIKVIRANGQKGRVSVKYCTEDDTALAGSDYDKTEGVLTFGPTETEKIIRVPIIDDEEFEKDEVFYVKLSKHDEGTRLGNLTVAQVIIENDDEVTEVGKQVMALLNMNMDKYKLGSSSYKQQFAEACEAPPPGSSPCAKFSHFLNVPWKLLAAIIPPTAFMGGWLCFIFSLIMIGLTTALIGDVANLFGCSLGIPAPITAITFVALGTSLPDTFASKSAAVGDATADSAIGNVTGSNAVNVFLGLGLPWTIAAIYWGWTNPDTKVWDAKYPEHANLGSAFIVPAGSLGFSVTVFVILAIVTLGIVWIRGKLFDGELGSKFQTPTSILFVTFWLLYISLSILKTVELI